MNSLNDRLAEARSRICDAFLVVTAIVAVLLLPVALYRAVYIGWQPVMGFNTVMAVLLWAVTLWRRRLPFAVRAGVGLFLIIAVGAGGIWQFGLIAPAALMLATAPIVATLFFGIGGGVGTLGAVAAISAAIAWLTVSGHRLPPFDLADYVTGWPAWTTAIIAWIFLGAGVAAAAHVMNRFFIASLEKAQRQADELGQRESQYRRLVDNIPEILYSFSEADGGVYYSPRVADIFGHSPEYLIAHPLAWHDSIHPDDLPMVDRAIAGAREGRGFDLQYRIRDADGRWHWLHDRSINIQGGRGATIIDGLASDITRRREAEEALKESERRFRDFTESGSDWFWEQDADLRFTDVTSFQKSGFIDRLGQVDGKTRWEVAGVDPGEDALWRQHRGDLLARRAFRDFRYTSVDDAGKTHVFSINGKPFFDDKGIFVGYRGTASDITSLVEAQENNERFLLALERLDQGFALWGADRRLILCNAFYRAGAAAAGIELRPGISFGDWYRILVRDSAIPEAKGREEEWLAERQAYFDNPVGANEVERQGRWYLSRMQVLPDGSRLHVVIDIDDMKATEEQLRQSQKLQAIGQLTGGVAHDFNNLLNVIVGNADMLQERFGADAIEGRFVDQILKAVERGAALTQRLLAFSRKQPLAPQPTDLKALVGGLDTLLRRPLGETIDLKIVAAPDLWATTIDTHQLENALINLAVNARDAMPGGGTLTIEAANTRLDETFARQHEDMASGDYVAIAVSDTGSGMAPEVVKQAFEPFFTTKDVGKGSGLGLSMVYGFAKQSNGHASIYSEPGHGTTVKLYLPRSPAAAAHDRDKDQAVSATNSGGRILVVEDDAEVRTVPVTILRDQGYAVIEAANGAEAIGHLRNGGVFDLLFTDVVLPGGMNGVAIAEEAQRLQPGIKVLFTSGYSENAIIHNGQLDPGVSLVSKPYRKAELLSKVEAALGIKVI